jgi:hypothetical protein
MIPSTSPTSRLSRRSLFAAGASVAGAAAVVVATAPAVSLAPVQASPRAVPEKGGGYHLSDHVRDYYLSTRI